MARYLWRALLALAALCAAGLALAQPLQPVPALQARVTDLTATLSAAQARALEDRLAAFEAAHGSQIVVLLVRSTAPEDIAAYAFRVADAWKIGRREVGDGVLLLVAKDDRKVRIEVARTLEGAIPDLAAWRIIDGAITPAFRRGDFAGGIDAGVEGLFALIRGEDLPAPQPAARSADGGGIEDLGALLLVGVPMLGAVLVGMLGRKSGAFATGGVTGLIVHLCRCRSGRENRVLACSSMLTCSRTRINGHTLRPSSRWQRTILSQPSCGPRGASIRWTSPSLTMRTWPRHGSVRVR